MMGWQDDQRARQDVLSGRRDPFGGQEYQDAHRRASSSAAEGAIAGGAAAGILGLLAMAFAGVVHLFVLVLREWLRGIGRAWRQSPLLGVAVLAAPPALIAVMVVAQVHRTHVAQQHRQDDAAERAATIEQTADYQKTTAKYGTPEAKRIGYMRNRLDQLPVVSRKYSAGFESWWRKDGYRDDKDFLANLREEECLTLYTAQSRFTVQDCRADFAPPANPSVVALANFDSFWTRSKNYRLDTTKYWQAYERGERAEPPSLH